MWVLTGDKPDTSISIAFSCKLITHDFIIFDFKGKFTKEDYFDILNKNLLIIELNSNKRFALLIVTDELSLISQDEHLEEKVRNIIYQILVLSACYIMQFTYMLSFIS